MFTHGKLICDGDAEYFWMVNVPNGIETRNIAENFNVNVSSRSLNINFSNNQLLAK